MVKARSPSSTASDWPVTVTVWAWFQFAVVKAREAVDRLASSGSRPPTTSGMVTVGVGWLGGTTEKVACPPASVVTSPAVGVTVMPAVSSSVTLAISSVVMLLSYTGGVPPYVARPKVMDDEVPVSSTASFTALIVTTCSTDQVAASKTRKAGEAVVCPSVVTDTTTTSLPSGTTLNETPTRSVAPPSTTLVPASALTPPLGVRCRTRMASVSLSCVRQNTVAATASNSVVVGTGSAVKTTRKFSDAPLASLGTCTVTVWNWFQLAAVKTRGTVPLRVGVSGAVPGQLSTTTFRWTSCIGGGGGGGGSGVGGAPRAPPRP